MKIRELQMKDAPLMLEWMHDDSVSRYFRVDFSGKTMEDCLTFIAGAQEKESIHLAIADDRDEYMGTVSLKHIRGNAAELGIVLRACAMGKGFAAYGLKKLMEYGREKYGIMTLYWCVDPENQRALRFYEKQGFHRSDVPAQAEGYTDEEKSRLIWYVCDGRTVDDHHLELSSGSASG